MECHLNASSRNVDALFREICAINRIKGTSGRYSNEIERFGGKKREITPLRSAYSQFRVFSPK